MRLEQINNKAIMNIGLINLNYNLDNQLEKIKFKSDTLIFFDNNDMLSILDYIRDTDTLFILSYSFVNDDPFEALNFKKELDKRKICIHSIMENTLKNSKAINDLTFNIFINLFEYSKFILDNRIKN